MIRRAILLRSVLKNNAPHLFVGPDNRELQMDPLVAYALLNVKEYRHGTRSMEAVISMSQLSDRDSFERSYLPSENQFGQHVEYGGDGGKEDIQFLMRRGHQLGLDRLE